MNVQRDVTRFKNAKSGKPYFSGEAAAYVSGLKCKTGRRRLVLLELAGFCNHETSECFPSQKLLAERQQITVRQALKHLAGLEEEGKLQRIACYDKAGGRVASKYVIVGYKEYKALPRDDTSKPQDVWERVYRENMRASEAVFSNCTPDETTEGQLDETTGGPLSKMPDIIETSNTNTEQKVPAIEEGGNRARARDARTRTRGTSG